MFVNNSGATPALSPSTCAHPVSVEHDGPVAGSDVKTTLRLRTGLTANRNQVTIWPGDRVPNEISLGPDDAITRARRRLSQAFVLDCTLYQDTFGSHHASWYCTQNKRDRSQDISIGCDRSNLPQDN